ncbi:MAG: AAC(3) family N-acetyltransferase [Richelia sp. SM2_1_7]|nr:AAC(3) family N-acetyltransferase [Richelia sp. SM2_1_7]
MLSSVPRSLPKRVSVFISFPADPLDTVPPPTDAASVISFSSIYQDIDFDTDCFINMGKDFEKAGYVKVSQVGSAKTKLFSVRDAVDFAVSWLREKEKGSSVQVNPN